MKDIVGFISFCYFYINNVIYVNWFINIEAFQFPEFNSLLCINDIIVSCMADSSQSASVSYSVVTLRIMFCQPLVYFGFFFSPNDCACLLCLYRIFLINLFNYLYNLTHNASYSENIQMQMISF